MAQQWLTHSMLPTTYWWFALKRACEVSNLMPINLNETVITPFEQVYNRKADY